MKYFSLQLDSPSKGIYFPGMAITGTVIATSDKPKDYRAIKVRLLGEANVHWTVNRGSGESDLVYDSHESYIDQTINVWEVQTFGMFTAGEHSFPFSFQLPRGDSIPASYSSSVGNITYKVISEVVKGTTSGTFGKRDETRCVVPITVSNVVDINKPNLLQPYSKEVSTSVCCWCCTSGPILITADLPRTGYCSQQDDIPLEIEIENGSGL